MAHNCLLDGSCEQGCSYRPEPWEERAAERAERRSQAWDDDPRVSQEQSHLEMERKDVLLAQLHAEREAREAAEKERKAKEAADLEAYKAKLATQAKEDAKRGIGHHRFTSRGASYVCHCGQYPCVSDADPWLDNRKRWRR